MTVAPPVPPSVHENSLNGSVHANGPMNPMALPRFHPIAMNPPPEAAAMQNSHHYRPFHPPPPPPSQQQQQHGPVQESGPAPPGLHPVHIDHIEARLRQLENEDAARMAARSQLLAIRKREDEDFRRMTESAEAEEEELRRQRKRLKRETMGLGHGAAGMDSPPLRPTPPRRLSETNAATTLAFFKQQTPPDPRPLPTPPSQAPPHVHQHPHPHAHPHAHHPHAQAHPHAHQHPQPAQIHPHPHPHSHVQVHPAAVPPPQPHHPAPHDSGSGSIRKKQKYTIKNVEAWGERHGRPASHDPSGRALWKRPSDGNLVYLTCPIPGCGKADFVTLHGFMCHLTKKHKDRSLGSQSRALEVCGVVFDPNAPLPPTVQRSSSEESRLESAPMDGDGYPQEMEYSTGSDDDEADQDPVKMEGTSATERPYGRMKTTSQPPDEQQASSAIPKMNGSTKQSISSIIDRNPEDEAMPPPPSETPRSVSQEQTSPGKGGDNEMNGSASQSDREGSSEMREGSDVKMETR